MLKPPAFSETESYQSKRGDVEFWWPYVREALKRHDLFDARLEPVAGHRPANPTFLVGDVAVKLFGGCRDWHRAYTVELAAQRLVHSDPDILTPRLLAHGRLFEDEAATWPYLITSVMHGESWRKAKTTKEQDIQIAYELGCQVKKIHALPIANAPKYDHWPAPDLIYGAEHSALPKHLIPQIDEFLSRTGPLDPVFVNGDLWRKNVYVQEGAFVGLIDWGDALVMDRHYELASLHLNAFKAKKKLLNAFLKGSRWPVAEDFAHKCLAMALHRQAMGVVQHVRFNAFYKLPKRMDLDAFATLDELALALFAFK